MTGWIDQHVPALVVLWLHQSRTMPHRLRRRCVKVRSCGEVEVHYRRVGPCGWGVRRYSLRDQDYLARPDTDASIVSPQDLAAKKLLIERPELPGVGTVERNGSDLERSHLLSVVRSEPTTTMGASGHVSGIRIPQTSCAIGRL
jgi:hypothetical protein